MNEILKAITGLGIPNGLALALSIVALVLVVMSRVRELLPWRWRYSKEKMRLELTKLYFEIEAIKKQHGMHGEKSPYLDQSRSEAGIRDLEKESGTLEGGIGTLERAIFGTLGGFAVGVLIAIDLAITSSGFTPVLIGFLGALFALAAAAAAYFPEQINRKESFLLGFVVVMFIVQVFAGLGSVVQATAPSTQVIPSDAVG